MTQRSPFLYSRTSSEIIRLAVMLFEHPTKPRGLVAADEGAAEGDEGLVGVGAPLVSRTVRRRRRLIQAKVSSTTQRCCPRV